MLATQGRSRTEIAKSLNVRYQHVQKVLVDSGLHIPKSREANLRTVLVKPELPEALLVNAGFQRVGAWRISGNELVLPDGVPGHEGVYAFSVEGKVHYVGVAKMGLRKRIYYYAKPGPRQKTSQRLNGLIKQLLQVGKSVEVIVALPSDFEWQGLPVHGPAGLEIGLIKRFALPWNVQGAR